MPSLCWTTIGFTLLTTSVLAQSNWNQDARDLSVKLHNDYRRGEGACQMNKMVYDMELERQAKKWAEGCVFEHETITGRGENLAWDSTKGPEKGLIESATKSWFDEKKLYTYGQDSCADACHYTQIVWDTTDKIGCWSTRCTPLTKGYTDAWYYVCFYTPAGNTRGVKPYQKICKTPCRDGQTLENKLCVNGDATTTTKAPGATTKTPAVTTKSPAVTTKAQVSVDKTTAAGPNGADPTGKPTNNPNARNPGGNPNPTTANPNGETPNENPNGANGNPNAGDPNSTPAGSPNSGGNPEDCKDNNSQCPQLANRGYCYETKRKAYMELNCKKSCGKCGNNPTPDPNQNCTDNNQHCPILASEQRCTSGKWKAFMETNCKLSCGVCTNPNCFDLFPDCWMARVYGCNDRKRGPFLRQNCPWSCGTC